MSRWLDSANSIDDLKKDTMIVDLPSRLTQLPQFNTWVKMKSRHAHGISSFNAIEYSDSSFLKFPSPVMKNPVPKSGVTVMRTGHCG
tara:strand:+ start:3020 stop:3280 length:261 start_codon:yes stop_codon:yes gene_type:complete